MTVIFGKGTTISSVSTLRQWQRKSTCFCRYAAKRFVSARPPIVRSLPAGLLIASRWGAA